MLAQRTLKILDTLATRSGAIFASLAIVALGFLLSIAAPGPGQPTAAVAAGASSAPAAEAVPNNPFNKEQTEAIGAIVKSYLLAHPEIIVEVSKVLEERQQAEVAQAAEKVVLDKKASIFHSSADGVTGNPNGDVTVVEFFDYNCPWCRKAVDEVSKLTKADPKVRVVLKEFPIFGEDSIFAAKAALASVAQGKYWEFHLAMLHEKQVSKANILDIAKKVGIDVERLKKDMADPKIDAALKETQELAKALGVEGTPGFLIDSKLNVGFVPYEGLVQGIAEVRKSGCKAC